MTVCSSLGDAALMGVGSLGVGSRAILFFQHVDSVSLAGLLMDDIWNHRRVITIDLQVDAFLETIKSGDPLSIKEDGTVEVSSTRLIRPRH